MACLGDDTIAAMLEGQLADASAREARLHIGNCDACRQLVAAAIGAPPSSSASSSRPREPLPTLSPGDRFGERYRVERRIGEGGMGQVIEARQLGLERKVAIKILQPALARDPVALARFHREARLAASLDSGHVARIYDLGLLETGEPFLVMELLDGEDLASVLSRGPLVAERATRYIVAACQALAEAHALGIVHRDIKPSNLFVTRGDRLVVLDFGLAKLTAPDAGSSVTHHGVVLGSPRYMAPEQIRGSRDVDARADLWSLGATLYHLVTGSPPFPGTTTESVFSQILDGPLPPLDALPPMIAHTIARALARDPARRFASAQEFALALTTRPPDLDARFEIFELLGEGSHGTVYRARHRVGGREVALKVLRGNRQQIRERFAREAAIVQRLEHPNTVRLYESGVAADGTPFMVFELVRGRTLAAELQRGALWPARVARIATQVGKALLEAHARGIVHRDIKPSNILLVDHPGDADFVKLVDFGVAADVEAPNLTLTGETLGTPRYMAPEQVLGGHVDGRADLYALGLVMAEALTGVPVFDGASAIAACMQQASPDPVPLPPAVTGGPFGETIARATAKRPEDRFASAADMLAAIDRGPREASRPSPIVERRPRSPMIGALVACVALLGAATVLLAWRPWAPDDEPAVQPRAQQTLRFDETRLRARLAMLGWPPVEVTHDVWGRCHYMRTRHEAGIFAGHQRAWAMIFVMTCDSDATARSEEKRLREGYPGAWTILDASQVLMTFTTAPDEHGADEASSKQLADVLLGADVPVAPPAVAAADAAVPDARGPVRELGEAHLRARLEELGLSPAEVTHDTFPTCRHTRFRLAAGTFQKRAHPGGDIFLLECDSAATAQSEAARLQRGFANASLVAEDRVVVMTALEDGAAAKALADALVAR